MTNHVIAIVGGTGSGKSTLAYSLLDKFPELIEIMHFDDYQKLEPNVPIQHGMRNWDCPNAIDFDQLIDDLNQLKNNKDVKMMTKDKKLNPNYETNGRIRIPRIMHSKKIIILEGYLALWSAKVRKLIDYTIFLDIHIGESLKRRDKVIDHDADEYNKKILIPGHIKYVESTKRFANLVINVEKTDKEDMIQIAIQKLREEKLIP